MRYIPLKLHCFPTSDLILKGQLCPVLDRSRISDANCTKEITELQENDIYAQMCFDNEFASSKFLEACLGLLVTLIISLLATFALEKLTKDKCVEELCSRIRGVMPCLGSSQVRHQEI